jgi:alpha-N-arabinofuranosidase
MQNARLVLDRDFTLGEVDPRLFGGFVEHLGRCVYGGIYEPGHPQADDQGFRQDVLALVRELDLPVMRYPGGNFVSGYAWEDGVGPAGQRPRRLDLAWQTLEPNTFGTDQFVDWCRQAGTAPLLTVNLGTRGAEQAQQLVEYCNHPGGTAWSDLRRRNGHADPHGVKLWCLGNELYGDWQMGHKTAREYGRTAGEAAKLMRWTDPSIERILCGADQAWNAEVLELAYDHTEYLSIHAYYANSDRDTPKFLAAPDQMDEFIRQTVATCDHVAARLRKTRPVMIAFDEWNVWDWSRWGGKPEQPWTVGPPLLEQVYTMEDALVVGGLMMTLLNHADRVKIGCLAQLVNVIAPIMTETGGRVWRQTIFHPVALTSRYGRGIVLRQAVESPVYELKDKRPVSCLLASAVLEPRTGGVTVFALNRSLEEKLRLRIEMRGFELQRAAVEWRVLRNPDLHATNTADEPHGVRPERATGARAANDVLSAVLDAASWNVLRVVPRR